MDRLALVDWIGWEGVQVAMEAPPVNAVEPEETREGGSFIHGNVIDFPEFHTRLAKPQKAEAYPRIGRTFLIFTMRISVSTM